jgi:hypothetical protein
METISQSLNLASTSSTKDIYYADVVRKRTLLQANGPCRKGKKIENMDKIISNLLSSKQTAATKLTIIFRMCLMYLANLMLTIKRELVCSL